MALNQRLMQRTLALLAFLHISVSGMASGATNSGAVDGVFVKLAWDGSDMLASSKKFYYSFLSTSASNSSLIFYPKREYICRMTLIHEDGGGPARTALGATYGNRFTQIGDYSTEMIETRSGGSSSGAPIFQRLRPEVGPQQIIPPLDTLFSLTNSGPWLLTCEFQVYAQSGHGTNVARKLIRFPAIEVPVSRR